MKVFLVCRNPVFRDFPLGCSHLVGLGFCAHNPYSSNTRLTRDVDLGLVTRAPGMSSTLPDVLEPSAILPSYTEPYGEFKSPLSTDRISRPSEFPIRAANPWITSRFNNAPTLWLVCAPKGCAPNWPCESWLTAWATATACTPETCRGVQIWSFAPEEKWSLSMVAFGIGTPTANWPACRNPTFRFGDKN